MIDNKYSINFICFINFLMYKNKFNDLMGLEICIRKI